MAQVKTSSTLKDQKDIEKKWIVDLKNGEEEAFIKIYSYYWKKIFTIAYQRVRSREKAEELVQDVFLKLWERRATLNIDDVGAYLFVAIRNAVIDHIRSGMRLNRYTEYYRAFVERNSSDATAEAVKVTDLEDAIANGLSQLPEKTQIVFRLSRIENWPLEKISNHLNLSEKTVGYHLTRALKFMRSYLKEFIFVLLMIMF